MNTVQRNIASGLKEHVVFTVVLGLTLLFFLYKGLTYALIGSYVPLGFILAILIFLVLASRSSKKVFKRMLGIWTILLMVWSVVRLLLILINLFIKPIPESHVSEQLGVFGGLLSVLFLLGAIYLLRYRKKLIKELSE